MRSIASGFTTQPWRLAAARPGLVSCPDVHAPPGERTSGVLIDISCHRGWSHERNGGAWTSGHETRPGCEYYYTSGICIKNRVGSKLSG